MRDAAAQAPTHAARVGAALLATQRHCDGDPLASATRKFWLAAQSARGLLAANYLVEAEVLIDEMARDACGFARWPALSRAADAARLSLIAALAARARAITAANGVVLAL